MKIQLPILVCGVRRREWTKDGKTHVMHFLDWYADEPHSSLIDEKEAEQYQTLKAQYANAVMELSEYKGEVRYKILAIRTQK